MNKLHFYAFIRGYWDSVQFGYIPDYDIDELHAWSSGFRWGKAEKGEPTIEDFDAICDKHNSLTK